MPSESEIILEIERQIIHLPSWTIGITDNPDRRKQEHSNPARWYQWNAVTETTARKIERHFLDKGMQGDVGGGVSPNYVYIFYSG